MSRAVEKPSWRDVELPCVLRYRRNAFLLHFIVPTLLFAGAAICIIAFGSLVAGLPLLVAGVMTLGLILVPMRHVRSIDYLEIDHEALTLVAKDGGELRIPFGQGVTFAVTYDQCCRSIVAYPGEGAAPWDGEHVVADVLDLPRGLDIYGLCDLMNGLGQRRRHGRTAGAGGAAIRRQRDWYREPARISRFVFLLGMIGTAVLLLCTHFALTLLTWSLSGYIGKPILLMAKTALSVLFVYPAFRFLVVARLRDLGEDATHHNGLGLAANSAAGGPLRLLLRPGQPGRNQFGPAPRV